MLSTNITSFLIFCIIITFTPGPTNIMVLTGVYNFGAKKTIKFVYGATLAFVLLLILSIVLSSMMITLIPKFLMILQLIGSGYMLYLAYQIYNTENTGLAAQQAITFKGGFLMQLMNPKFIIFTLTVIPNFIMPYDASMFDLMIAVLAVASIGFSAMITWMFFGTVFKEFLDKYHKTVNIVMSIFLIYSAITLFHS